MIQLQGPARPATVPATQARAVPAATVSPIQVSGVLRKKEKFQDETSNFANFFTFQVTDIRKICKINFLKNKIWIINVKILS